MRSSWIQELCTIAIVKLMCTAVKLVGMDYDEVKSGDETGVVDASLA